MKNVKTNGLRTGSVAPPAPEVTGARDPLRIATEVYAAKPMAAFFQAFELRAYVESGAALREPALDLGCGDGTFGRMLCSALGSSAKLTGVDMCAAAIGRARRRESRYYERFVCADSRRLPFETGSFATIIANGSIGCGAGTKEGLDEAARVLAPGGMLYCTVPTPRFDRNLWLVRTAEAMAMPGLARGYVQRVHRRFTHVRCLDAPSWARALAEHGLTVRHTVGFFPERLVTPWSVLAARPVSVHALLRAPLLSALAPAAGLCQRGAFGSVYRRTPVHTPPDRCAYLLLHVERADESQLQPMLRRDRDELEPAGGTERVGGAAS